MNKTVKKEGVILVIDDDDDILTAGKLLLKRHFSHVVCSNRPQMIPQLMKQQRFDAILLDMNFGPGQSSGDEGYHWLKEILLIDPQAVVIMITAHGDVATVVEAMKLGATDFVSKPWQNEKIVATVSTAVQLNRSRDEATQLRSANKVLAEVSHQHGGQKMLGDSNAIRQVKSLIERSAPTDASVLILGENGTGKELVARELHCQSLRADKVFLSVDLGAVSETLFESELFGHKKGAFTGAGEERTGRLKAADGGTLFLDEIGNLPLNLQAKLLSVLAERKVTPLGSNTPVSFDVRVIAATNLSRENLADEGRFRQDLLYRLNTVEIILPPLRQRSDDIEGIACYYCGLYSRKYNKTNKAISADALAAMKSYSWPGNIRSLRHAIERAVIMSEGLELDIGDVQLPMPNPGNTRKLPAPSFTQQNTTQAPEAIPAIHHPDLNLDQIEKNTIRQALTTHSYNISHSAKALGLTRAALYRRMEKHGL